MNPVIPNTASDKDIRDYMVSRGVQAFRQIAGYQPKRIAKGDDLFNFTFRMGQCVTFRLERYIEMRIPDERTIIRYPFVSVWNDFIVLKWDDAEFITYECGFILIEREALLTMQEEK